jgi:regulator of sigma E protease
MAVLLLVLGLVLFIGLVVIHELGHFFVARRNGVVAEEFGIFFPPKIWSRKIKGRKGRKSFIFSINALPLGGFVRLKGEHDSDTEPGSFGAANTWVKTKVMAAGVGVNLLAAFVILVILAWAGMPQLLTKDTVGQNQFTVQSDTHVSKREVLAGAVVPGSPAAKAGIQPNDQLLSIMPEGKSPIIITDADTVHNITKSLAGQKVQVAYLRNGQQQNAAVTLLSANTVSSSQKQYNNKVASAETNCTDVGMPKGYLGISPTAFTLQQSTWSAPVVAGGIIGQFTVLTMKGLGTALRGLGSAIAGLVTVNHAARENGQCAASSQVSGPVGIFVVLKDGSALGPQFMLMIIAVISLTLAIMNILPIPALDGGKLFLTLGARLFNRRLSESFEEWAYGASFLVLIGLIVLITVVDVKRFF